MSRDAFAPKDAVWSLAHRASRAFRNHLARLFAAQEPVVTEEQWRVLMSLDEEEPVSQKEIGRRIGQEKTGVSRLLSGLERKGLLKRGGFAGDKRVNLVRLTPEGAKVRRVLNRLATRALVKAQGGIVPEKLGACKEALAAIITNLEPKPDEESR